MIPSCQFCDLANGIESANIFYQTHHVCCSLDINPIHEGHILIVPKKHFLDVDELDQETRIDIMNPAALLSRALKERYSPDGISIMQNGGIFNDVNHYHMHIFPRYKNDGFSWVEPHSSKNQLMLASETASVLQEIVEKLI